MASGGGQVAIVPLKDRQHAKQRLASVLSPEERAGFAWAMAEDVLATLAAVPGLAGIVLVTRDQGAASLAARFGARVLADPDDCGINAAVVLAERMLVGAGKTGMLVVPADVPLISPAEVEAVCLAHGTATGVTIVPALVDMGTNGLVCSPVDAICPQFGPGSYFRHRDAALDAGLQPRILPLPGWSRDIDRPEDLLVFVATPSSTRSYDFLQKHGIVARLRSPSGRHALQSVG